MTNSMVSTGYHCIPHLNTNSSCRTILSVPCTAPQQFGSVFQKDMGYKSWVGFLLGTRAKQIHKSLQALLDILLPLQARQQLSFCYKTSPMYQRINESGSASFPKQPVNTRSAVLSIQVLLPIISFLPSDDIQAQSGSWFSSADRKVLTPPFCKPSLGTVTL